MLVLTRKLNESVFIDDQIEVMVVAVRGNKVRLGFRAPADVSIRRKERTAVTLDEPHAAFAELHVGEEEHAENDLVALHFGNARGHHRPR